MNMIEYLQNNFHAKKVNEIVVNGQVKGYYAKSTNGDEIYLPANTTGNVGMLSYIPGSGGSGNDAAKLREIIQNNPPSYPITIAAECSDRQHCIEVGYNLAKGANMEVTNNVTVCFSASGYLGISRTESFADTHPDVVSTIISCEPYGEGNYRYKNPADVDGLTNSNSQIIFVAPKSGFHINIQDEIKKMTSAGLNAYFLGTKYSGNLPSSVHIMTNRDVLQSGMVDYLLGYADDFNKNPGNGAYSANYQLVKFNKDTGQYEDMSYEDIAAAVVSIKIPDIEKLKAFDAFTIVPKESPVHSKYSGLSNVGQKSITGTVMKTEYTYSADQMNHIRDLVKNTSFVSNFSNIGFRSGEGIPGCINAYLNAYFDIVGSLLNSIVLETDSVFSYTQAANDLEADLANSLSPGQIVQNGELKGYIKIGDIEEQKPSENITSKETTTTETATDGTTGGTNGGTTGEYTGGTTGGGTNEGTYVPAIPINTEETTTEEITTPEEVEPNYRYDFDGYQGLIYMDGNKISKVVFRYSYSNEVEAQKNLQTIKEKYVEKEFIREVVQKGKYVDAVFNEEMYKEKTYEDFVKDFFKGGKIHA